MSRLYSIHLPLRAAECTSEPTLLCSEEDADAIKYVNRIQQDLLDKGIILFMIKSVNDRIRVDELPDNEIKEFLKKVLLAYEYKNDDRWR